MLLVSLEDSNGTQNEEGALDNRRQLYNAGLYTTGTIDEAKRKNKGKVGKGSGQEYVYGKRLGEHL